MVALINWRAAGEFPSPSLRGGVRGKDAESNPSWAIRTAIPVMAGLVPAIHAAPFPTSSGSFRRPHGVDGRDKPGHDGVVAAILAPVTPAPPRKNRKGSAAPSVLAFPEIA